MSPNAVKFLIQPETFNKVWRRQPPWCVSIVKPAQRKRKETFHVLTSFCFLLLFFFCLCLFYFSLYCRIHFFLISEHHMNMPHRELQWSGSRVKRTPLTSILMKCSEGKNKFLSVISLCKCQEGPLGFQLPLGPFRVTWKMKPIKTNLIWKWPSKKSPLPEMLWMAHMVLGQGFFLPEWPEDIWGS